MGQPKWLLQNMSGLRGLLTDVTEHGWVSRGMGSLVEVVGEPARGWQGSAIGYGILLLFHSGAPKEKAAGSTSRNNL